MTQPAQIKKDSSLTETVYRAIRSDLLMCKIAPGAHMKTSDFARQYGVSLASVREAMTRLSAESLVGSEPQRGFFAAPLSAEQLVDLTSVRTDIEAQSLRQSIAQFTVIDDLRLDEALESLTLTATTDENGNHVLSEEWSRAHILFHEELVRGCRNKVLLQLRRTLFDQSERYRSLAMQIGGGKKKRDIDLDHRPMVEAVHQRDSESAVNFLIDHINATTRVLLLAKKDGQALLPRNGENG